MKRRTIRILIFFAVVSVLGILGVQTYWFRQAFNAESDRFHRDVNTALFNVASTLFAMNNVTEPNMNPIRQLSTNYYAVMINDQLDASLLETLLRKEFMKRDLRANFEYGIYDCTNEKMVYGNFVQMTDDPPGVVQASTLPVWEDQPYYFGVHFPDRTSVIANRMEIWIFSSGVLGVVVIFFGYALFIILRQRRLSEIQKDFINNMTHEFKTPLSTIQLSSEVLRDPAIRHTPERLSRYASIIDTESQRLREQVERILEMARVDQEDFTLEPHPVRLNALVCQSVQDSGLQLSEYHGFVCLDLENGLPEVEGDAHHITNVLHNLLDNALKYCTNRPRITISTRMHKQAVQLVISDNGIGIHSREQRKVFHKFYRVPTGNIHDVKGFGLGLNYVKTVMEKLKGSVKFTSHPGQGSVVTLTFMA